MHFNSFKDPNLKNNINHLKQSLSNSLIGIKGQNFKFLATTKIENEKFGVWDVEIVLVKSLASNSTQIKLSLHLKNDQSTTKKVLFNGESLESLTVYLDQVGIEEDWISSVRQGIILFHISRPSRPPRE